MANDGGSRHSGKLELEQSLQYVETQFAAYVEALGGGPDGSPTLEGCRVLEVGPGDSNAVAALFVAAGASEVVCLDRFRPGRDHELDETICRAVLDRFDPASIGLDRSTGVPGWDDVRRRVTYRPGVPLERAPEESGIGRFDLIVSNAVLEHVYDLPGSFAAMDRLLERDGALVHLVDLRDHGLYSSGGHHPLTHLTLPGPLYRFITQPSGAPNRALAPHYIELLDELGYDVEITPTHLVFDDGESAAELKRYWDGSRQPKMAAIRPRLAPEFRSMTDADLNIAGILLVAGRVADRPNRWCRIPVSA